MTSLIHGKNDSFIFRKNLLTIGGLLIAVSAALFLPELLGIHPQKPQHFSQTLRVNQHRIARNVQITSNSIGGLIGTTAQTAAKDEKFNSSQTDSETDVSENLETISPEVAQVGLRARQAITSITEPPKLQPVIDSGPIIPITPEFAVLSWEEVGKSEIQEHLKRISNDTIQLLSLLSTEEFPRSNFELRSFQSALHPLLTPKKREKSTSLIQVLEFLDYRDSMVTAALLQERAPRKAKLAWKATSLKHVLNNSLSQQRKAEINTTFRPDFYLTEVTFEYDWADRVETRFKTPIRASVSGVLEDRDIQHIEWYYSDTPWNKFQATIVEEGSRKFFIPKGSDTRHSTLIIVAVAQDGSQYAKGYRLRGHRDKFKLQPFDLSWQLVYKSGKPDPRIEKMFLFAEGVKNSPQTKQRQLAWRSGTDSFEPEGFKAF